MTFEIKISKKPIDYEDSILFLENKFNQISQNSKKEFIWILEHKDTYTAGASFQKKDILDQNIKIINTKRGGKITWHGKGQLVCYFVIDLKKRKKDVRRFVKTIEATIIQTLKYYNINSFSDRKNVGIWVNHNYKIKKVAAIGIRIKKWIAYHGFAINIKNKLDPYSKIIPCGIKDKSVTSLMELKKQNYKDINKILQNYFIKNLNY